MVEEAKNVFLGYSKNDTNDNYNTRFEPPKNYEFYFSKVRSFRVSRAFYPQYYSDGYIYGRYEKEKYTKWYNETYKTEKTENEIKEEKTTKNSKGDITRAF